MVPVAAVLSTVVIGVAVFLSGTGPQVAVDGGGDDRNDAVARGVGATDAVAPSSPGSHEGEGDRKPVSPSIRLVALRDGRPVNLDAVGLASSRTGAPLAVSAVDKSWFVALEEPAVIVVEERGALWMQELDPDSVLKVEGDWSIKLELPPRVVADVYVDADERYDHPRTLYLRPGALPGSYSPETGRVARELRSIGDRVVAGARIEPLIISSFGSAVREDLARGVALVSRHPAEVVDEAKFVRLALHEATGSVYVEAEWGEDAQALGLPVGDRLADLWVFDSPRGGVGAELTEPLRLESPRIASSSASQVVCALRAGTWSSIVGKVPVEWESARVVLIQHVDRGSPAGTPYQVQIRQFAGGGGTQFRFSGLSVGLYRVLAWRLGERTRIEMRSFECRVLESEIVRVVWSHDDANRISLRLVGPDGAPIEDESGFFDGGTTVLQVVSSREGSDFDLPFVERFVVHGAQLEIAGFPSGEYEFGLEVPVQQLEDAGFAAPASALIEIPGDTDVELIFGRSTLRSFAFEVGGSGTDGERVSQAPFEGWLVSEGDGGLAYDARADWNASERVWSGTVELEGELRDGPCVLYLREQREGGSQYILALGSVIDGRVVLPRGIVERQGMSPTIRVRSRASDGRTPASAHVGIKLPGIDATFWEARFLDPAGETRLPACPSGASIGVWGGQMSEWYVVDEELPIEVWIP